MTLCGMQFVHNTINSLQLQLYLSTAKLQQQIHFERNAAQILFSINIMRKWKSQKC